MPNSLNPVYNHTKIVATMGPASSKKETLRHLIQAGVDVVRLNASHGTHAEHQAIIDTVREINEQEKMNISILLDLQGPKIRMGKLKQALKVKVGDQVTLTTAQSEQTDERLPIEYETFAKDVQPGDKVLIEDGRVRLRVEETDGETDVTLKVLAGSKIESKKGVNLPDTSISLPSITPKDMRDMVLAIRNDIEWIALSFVRTADDVHLLRRILRENETRSRIVSKIEKPEAVENIHDIIDASDAVMIARGDLGVEIPISDVPFVQKDIARRCTAASRPVIVATQMLDSMIEQSYPTRAEATDVANAVLDGADALMLSGETSIGKYPVETVRTMQELIYKAEQEASVFNRNLAVSPASRTYLSDAICMTAVTLADQVEAKGIVAMTSSGYTAFQLSKHRPEANIFIFTDNRHLLSTLNLVWGVRALYYDGFEGTDETIRDVIRKLKDLRHVRPGDVVINTASMPIHARKRTNMVKITKVE